MTNAVKNYTLYNLVLVNANQEYSQAITANRCHVRIHAADLSSTARLSFTALGSATGEVLFQGSEWFTPEPFGHGDKTIYMQSPNAGVTFQIIIFEVN
mgnify:CR=1 FL=1